MATLTAHEVTNAINQSLLQGGSRWVVGTISAFMPGLWVLTVLFHLARPYVFRTLKKLSLRFGADVWWLAYVLMRDGVVLLTLALSTIFLFPNLLITVPVPLTAPLAALLLFASLYVKLLYDADEDFQAYRLQTVLLAVGVALYMVPQIFGVEATSQSSLAGVVTFLTSTSNTAWVGPIVAIALIGYGVIGVLIFYQVVIAGRRFGERRDRVGTVAPITR
ncbi:MAG: hypothetical protein M0T77_05800 [Actinomycetota bacterium]|nr:hypothetical protein [Actinomycetota bacterium]